MTIETLGDPHLGRSFVNGVPLHRRGDRENMVWRDFQESLYKAKDRGVDIHVCMGDLFDKAIVPYTVVWGAARAYLHTNRQTQFYVLRGNHDASRDLERKSAFDLFALAVSNLPHVHVVTKPLVVDGIGFFPWDPVRPAEDLIEPCEIAFGHWDVDPRFSGDNLIPTRRLAEIGCKQAFTGHIHKPDRFTRDGVDVTVVGSMQPYAFGEQADDGFYVELTLDELAHAGDLHDKVVKVRLKAGEILDQEVDCLQLRIERETEDGEEIEVTLGDFDMEKLFGQAFDEAGVDEDIRTRLLERYRTGRA